MIVIPSVLVLVGAVVLLGFARGTTDHVPSSETTAGGSSPSPTAPVPSVGATPSASDHVPSPDVTDSVQPEPTPVGPATVTIVNWGADGRSVFASGIVTGETGDRGTCTLTASSSTGQTLSGQRAAEMTPAAANCGVIQIAAPAGDWTLVLDFRSDSAAGSSTPETVVQP